MVRLAAVFFFFTVVIADSLAGAADKIGWAFPGGESLGHRRIS